MINFIPNDAEKSELKALLRRYGEIEELKVINGQGRLDGRLHLCRLHPAQAQPTMRAAETKAEAVRTLGWPCHVTTPEALITNAAGMPSVGYFAVTLPASSSATGY